jgi:hypothetical protein
MVFFSLTVTRGALFLAFTRFFLMLSSLKRLGLGKGLGERLRLGGQNWLRKWLWLGDINLLLNWLQSLLRLLTNLLFFAVIFLVVPIEAFAVLLGEPLFAVPLFAFPLSRLIIRVLFALGFLIFALFALGFLIIALFALFVVLLLLLLSFSKLLGSGLLLLSLTFFGRRRKFAFLGRGWEFAFLGRRRKFPFLGRTRKFAFLARRGHLTFLGRLGLTLRSLISLRRCFRSWAFSIFAVSITLGRGALRLLTFWLLAFGLSSSWLLTVGFGSSKFLSIGLGTSWLFW